MTPIKRQLIDDALQELMPTWPLDAISGLAYLAGGYSNENYKLCFDSRYYVLRLPTMSQPFVNRHHEWAWYQQMDGISVQPISFSVASGCMLTPWLAGDLLVDVADQYSQQTLIKYLHDLHANLPNPQRDYNVDAICGHYWPSPPYSIGPPEVSVACHNDLNPWNIMVTDAGWITLDWEFVGNNDPLFDVVALHRGLELDADTLADFVLGYLGVEHLPVRRLEQVLKSYWLREWGWANFQIKQGNERDEIRQQANTAKTELYRITTVR